MEWDDDEIELYVDDDLYLVVNKYEMGEADWVFDHPFFFILNVAVGGNWPGYPDETTVFPQIMEVDYIRVYEDTDSRTISGLEVWDCEYEKMIKEKRGSITYTEGEVVNGNFERDIVNKQEESLMIGTSGLEKVERLQEKLLTENLEWMLKSWEIKHGLFN